jgi:hypothetical protein
VLFTMMVLMALLTTVATTPALQLLGVDRARMFLRYNPAGASRSASKW